MLLREIKTTRRTRDVSAIVRGIHRSIELRQLGDRDLAGIARESTIRVNHACEMTENKRAACVFDAAAAAAAAAMQTTSFANVRLRRSKSRDARSTAAPTYAHQVS